MSENKIAAIMRAGAYSPNRIGNDTAIFNLVAEQLRKRGYSVNVYSEEEFLNRDITERVIVNMCREMRSIEKLQKLEDDGALVVNSGYGIENTLRERMTRILLGSGIPYPRSIFVNTDESVTAELRTRGISRCWIKRGDFHAIHQEDVTFVRDADEAQEVLQEYFLRGIKRAVITEHLHGELLKFYGVQGTSFFYTTFPFHSEDTLPSLHINISELQQTCDKAAEAIGIIAYGGDCIVAPDGKFTIIDFNDWPSYSPCRTQAAPQIARRILHLIKTK